MDTIRMSTTIFYTVIQIVGAIKILKTANIEQLDNNKFKNKMYYLYISSTLESILRTLSQVKTSKNKIINDKLLTLIDTPGERVDLIFIGEIESMLDIVEWTLSKHSEMLTLLTDGGKEFDSELLRLKKIIVKYAELENVLVEESLTVDY